MQPVKAPPRRLEAQLLAFVQMRKLRTVRRGDLVAPPLRMTPDQERKLLSRLSRAGLIARVWRGLYLVPPRLPLGGIWSPSEYLALETLMEELGGRYQICGPNAFNRYGFDEQVPTRVYAYNDRISGARRIGSVELELILVARKRLGDAEATAGAEGERAWFASRVRTLVDAVYDWARFDSLPRGFRWIRAELAAKRVLPADLVRCTLRYGDVGTIRRIGAVLEDAGVSAALLRKLARALSATTSSIPLDPTRPKRGRMDRRWGVIRNERP
jgi:predicted transcriptional regulator of viral defense system